jgi:hypothetical protein
MTVQGLIPVIQDEAHVGESLHLVADTKVNWLASLTETYIHYKQGRRAAVGLAATIVSGEPSKLEAVVPYTNNDLSCMCRLWATGRGTGTPVVRFHGTVALLRIRPEGG